MSLFQEFPKLARLSRTVTLTEKLDGTNGQILIVSEEEARLDFVPESGYVPFLAEKDGFQLWAGSRSRMLTPESDNFGFAKWVKANAEELLTLGPGRHFGEWWGKGIQRGYGLDQKRFSLFNTARWGVYRDTDKYPGDRPSVCGVVPVLYRGIFTTELVEFHLEQMRKNGSTAVPGYMKPEGIVVYHEAANMGFKKTLDNDAVPKSMVR